MTVGAFNIGRSVLAAVRSDRRMSASDVADVAQCNTATARGWLELLADAGVLKRGHRAYSGKTGTRPIEYWRARDWGGAG